MKNLTVITTTYNREYCLHQVYESLIRQTSNDFLWLVIDDGSTDNTKELINNWQKENKIVIEYFYKPNGGMHTARNLAYEKCYTPLNVIIDSDDWMTDNAVELINDFWKENGCDKYSGIISNNISSKGNMIGTILPEVKSSKVYDLFYKQNVKGDKKIILRTDLAKLNPFPEFPGEKFFPASYKYYLLDQDYEMLIMNEYICIVDYNLDSMTYNKFAQYKSCANGFAFYRNEMIKISKSPKFIITSLIHYIAECKLANKKNIVKDSSKPFYAFLLYPIGILYYYYLTHTKKKY